MKHAKAPWGFGAPRAIVEVIQTRVPPPESCSCNRFSGFVLGRFICGSFDADATVGLDACSPPHPTMPPAVLVVHDGGCNSVIYHGDLHPMSEWDAIVAEQIAGGAGVSNVDHASTNEH